MNQQRYIIEFGLGLDFHGQNINRAAQKAVKDAISRSCLCGLTEVLHLKNLDQVVRIQVTVAVSRPEEIDPKGIAGCLPIGTVEVRAVSGGLTVPGLYVPAFGDRDDSIEAALACVEVFVSYEK